MQRQDIVLGIETSCDETAAALVRGDRSVLAAPLFSQLAEHAPYGGVVPEIAARAHVEKLDRLIAEALATAQVGFDDLAGIAATAGPGLIGGLMVGLLTGKTLALVRKLPFVAVNHLEAHALTARFVADLQFPYLLLLVSGGHTQFVAVHGVGRHTLLGTTIDDALGEAYDKTAKMLGLGYPGGPQVEQVALRGDPGRFDLPRPLQRQPGCDFSFSGLKTAVRQRIIGLGEAALDRQTIADMCASFQAAIVDCLADRTRHALRLFTASHDGPRHLVVAGGVAANRAIRQRLHDVAEAAGFGLVVPPPALCTDNAVMVAWAGIERLRLGGGEDQNVPARARWPLAELTPP